jgi:hypothetical protein
MGINKDIRNPHFKTWTWNLIFISMILKFYITHIWFDPQCSTLIGIFQIPLYIIQRRGLITAKFLTYYTAIRKVIDIFSPGISMFVCVVLTEYKNKKKMMINEPFLAIVHEYLRFKIWVIENIFGKYMKYIYCCKNICHTKKWLVVISPPPLFFFYKYPKQYAALVH